MNREVEYIERLKIELSDLHKKIQSINPYESREEYDYLTYKIEILKRDIQIHNLLLPHIQKALYEPMPPIYIKQDKKLLEALKWIDKANGGRLPQYKIAYLEKAKRLIKKTLGNDNE